MLVSFLAISCRGPESGDADSVTRGDSPTWEVRFSHVLSTNSEFHLLAERFRDLMLERTGGRFRVVIYPSGQLGGERVAFEQIQVGAVHMAITGTPVLSGWVPEAQIFDLPFLFENRDHGLAVMNGPVGDWWRELLLERTGVRSLGFLDYGFRHVYNRRRPVETPEDLAGLKLRVLQNATYLAAYSALGVQATPMNYGEVYSALQQGVIDGGEANAIGFVSSRLYEVARFYSFTSITYNPITLLVNEPFYRALPDDIREIVDRSAADALVYQSEDRPPDGGGGHRADAGRGRGDLASGAGAVRPGRAAAHLGRAGGSPAGRRGADREACGRGGARTVECDGIRKMRQMRNQLQASNRALVAFETCAAGVRSWSRSAVVVLLQVLMRYLFAYPNPWSEEVSRFCFIWLSLLGASLAVEHRAHFGFDQVTKALAPRAKRVVGRGSAERSCFCFRCSSLAPASRSWTSPWESARRR